MIYKVTKQLDDNSQLPAPLENQDHDLLKSRISRFDVIHLNKAFGWFGETLPITVRVAGTSAQTAGQFTAPFFIANRNYQVISVIERHETAGSDAGAVTVMLKKVPSGTAPGSGTDMLTAGLSLKTTANTNQSGSVTTTLPNQILTTGNALSLVTTGTLTDLVGVTVTVRLKAI